MDTARLDELTREELIDLLKERAEGGVSLIFSGKANARRLARKVRPRVTRYQDKLSVGDPDEQSLNQILEGDNLQAMVTLYRERGLVDLILTDPPYNTGNDWRYNDKWDEDPNDPGLGEFVSADDGARHTKWMKFMWPRLQMMRSMLKPSGVLAICIDHRELFRLGQMLDELFGEKNRIAIINWQKSYSPRSDNQHVSTATEYVLVYAKDSDQIETGLLPRTIAMNKRYKSPDGDLRLWKGENFSGPKAKTHQGMVYGIQSPFTGDIHYPPQGKCWRSPMRDVKDWLENWGVEYKLAELEDGAIRAGIIGIGEEETPRTKAVILKTPVESASKIAYQTMETQVWPIIVFGLDGKGRPQQKKYLEEVKKGRVPMTFWSDEEFGEPIELGPVSWAHQESGHSQTGVNELTAIVGPGHNFETVKPLKLFTKIIQLWCPPDGLVLDPFSGSGTTGHAVLDLNYNHGFSRRFILIEQGRPIRGDSYARTLTADRVRRVIDGDWASGEREPLGGGFRFSVLGNKVDASALLQMERDEMVDTVIASHFDSNRRRGSGLVSIPKNGYRYLVAKNVDNEGVFLVWDGANKNTDFTESVYESCSLEAEEAGLNPFFHVYARLYLYQSEDVNFYQIPDRILADFGLNLRNEAFHEVSE